MYIIVPQQFTNTQYPLNPYVARTGQSSFPTNTWYILYKYNVMKYQVCGNLYAAGLLSMNIFITCTWSITDQ